MGSVWMAKFGGGKLPSPKTLTVSRICHPQCSRRLTCMQSAQHRHSFFSLCAAELSRSSRQDHAIRTRDSSHNPVFAALCSSLVVLATVPVSPCELHQSGLPTNCDSSPKGPHCPSLTSLVSS